ncbi:MAG: HD domain-containing protein [Acidobacteriaceae bacterium]|nr:HD domain-containing protein [Acidobacteriaceae bacterium]MBV9781455.1 HD domain-containing protein [Acidobacteriaceae bacterium]
MKSPYIGNLVPNEVVTAQFLVLSKEIRQKKTGEPYLVLHLADRTGEIEAKMWDNVGEVMHVFDRDDFVKVKGVMQLYQTRAQFVVHRLRRLQDHEIDFADYFPCSERDPDEMFAELRSIIASISNSHLRAMLEGVFSDPRLAELYKLAPAAKNIHHACRGGLIEHVLSLCKLCRLVGPHYKDIDLDLLLTGAILHDIGKIDELAYSRSFGYSPEGQLLGHIIIGLRLLASKFDQLPNFPPRLRMLLEHIIVSHHGELEFGSPKLPAFPEALLLHHLDNLDSKMEAMRVALNRDRVEGEFTGWVGSLERIILKKDRFLGKDADSKNETAPALNSAPEATAESAPEPSSKPAHPASPGHEPRPARNEHKPPMNTLFAEKLQAVLDEQN